MVVVGVDEKGVSGLGMADCRRGLECTAEQVGGCSGGGGDRGRVGEEARLEYGNFKFFKAI